MHPMRVARAEHLSGVIRRMQLITPVHPTLGNDGIGSDADPCSYQMHSGEITEPRVNYAQDSTNHGDTYFIKPHAPALIFNESLTHLFVNHPGILNDQVHVPAVFTSMDEPVNYWHSILVLKCAGI